MHKFIIYILRNEPRLCSHVLLSPKESFCNILFHFTIITSNVSVTTDPDR